jgi:membrane-associated phospholipid phosphatase
VTSPPQTVAPRGKFGVAPGVAAGGRRRRPSGEPPPLPRQLNTSGKYWLAAAVSLLAFSLIHLATSSKAGIGITVADRPVLVWLGDLRTPALTSLMRGISATVSPVPVQIAWLIALAVLVGTRRWRHLFVSILALGLTNAVVTDVAGAVRRPRPLGVEILGPWTDFSMPSLPIAILAALALTYLYALIPQGRWRQVGKWVATGLVAVLALARMYLAQDYPSDVVVGVILGVTIPLVAFRLMVPNEVFPISYSRRWTAHLEITGRRYTAICRALEDQLGVHAEEITPFGLEGSGGSTPLRVKVAGEPETYLFCKLYAANHVRSDRWYKMGRTLLYGGLEDEKAFNSVRRLVQYEDYALRLLSAAELPVPAPGGIVEITPEREYLLVMEFFAGARELGDVPADEAIID